jgi:TonB family protein
MFDALIVSKKSRVSSISIILAVVSLSIHLSAIGGVTLAEYVTVPPIHPPSVSEAFVSRVVLILPPLPPMPVAGRRSSGVPTPKPNTPPPSPKKIFQPVEIGDPPPTGKESELETNVPNLLGEGTGENEGNTGIPGMDGYIGPGEPSPLAPTEPKFVRLTSEMTKPVAFKIVKPVYPDVARKTAMTCRVSLLAKIDIDGRVVGISIVDSCPAFEELFNQAVIDAVSQWKFSPATLNKFPIPVEYQLTVVFSLN